MKKYYCDIKYFISKMIRRMLCDFNGHKKLGIFNFMGTDVKVCYYCGEVGIK